MSEYVVMIIAVVLMFCGIYGRSHRYINQHVGDFIILYHKRIDPYYVDVGFSTPMIPNTKERTWHVRVPPCCTSVQAIEQ
jgi:hypothetical protein